MVASLQHTKAKWEHLWSTGSGERSEAAAAAGLNMELMCVRILLLLLCFANSQFSSNAKLFVQDPDAEWKRQETEINEQRSEAPDFKLGRSASKTLQPLPVPNYVVVPASKVHKGLFKPEKNTRPLPTPIKEMLLGAKAPTTTVAPPTRQPLVEILCQIDRMLVRIRKNVFKSLGAHKYLKVGKCPVTHGTKKHYYFLYLLNIDCGYLREVGSFLGFLFFQFLIIHPFLIIFLYVSV